MTPIRKQSLAALLATAFLLAQQSPVLAQAQEDNKEKQDAPQPVAPQAEPGEPAPEPSEEEKEPATTLPAISTPTPPVPGPVEATTGASRGAPLAGTSQIGGGSSFAGGVAPSASSLLQFGPVQLHPHFSYRISYGDSLQARPGEQVSSFIHRVEPGILANIGKRWFLDYTPSLLWYSDDAFDDGVDHRVAFNGGADLGAWELGLSQGYSKTSDPLIETGGQTDQETFPTSITATRELNTKLSLDLGLYQNLRFVDGDPAESLTDSRQWSTMDWIKYAYTPKLTFGLGAGFTYDDVETGADMTSEQIQGRIGWKPGEKLSLNLTGGADIRQFIDSDVSDMASPIFSLSAQYQPFTVTTVSLYANRTVTPSYFQDAVSESVGFGAGLRQRFFGKVYLNLNGSYSLSDYTATSIEAGAREDQETTSLGASLSMAFLKRGEVSVFYSKSWNTSDSDAYEFDPETLGAQVFWRF